MRLFFWRKKKRSSEKVEYYLDLSGEWAKEQYLLKPKPMESVVIITKDEGVITIHFEGDVSFAAGWDYAGELANHNVDIVAYSNEFEKLRGSKTVETLVDPKSGDKIYREI